MHVSSVPPILGGREPYLLHMYCQAILYPLGASSSLLSVTYQMLCHVYHSLPSTTAIPVWFRVSCCWHLLKLGTTMFCDPLTSGPTSTSQCYYHFLYVYHQWLDEDHLVMPLHLLVVPLHLQLPPLHYHRIQETSDDSCHLPLPLLHCLPS